MKNFNARDMLDGTATPLYNLNNHLISHQSEKKSSCLKFKIHSIFEDKIFQFSILYEFLKNILDSPVNTTKIT